MSEQEYIPDATDAVDNFTIVDEVNELNEGEDSDVCFIDDEQDNPAIQVKNEVFNMDEDVVPKELPNNIFEDITKVPNNILEDPTKVSNNILEDPTKVPNNILEDPTKVPNNILEECQNEPENLVKSEDGQEVEEVECTDESKTRDVDPDLKFGDETAEIVASKVHNIDVTQDKTIAEKGEDGASDKQSAINRWLDISQNEETTETHPYLYLIETFDYPKEQVSLTTVGNVKTLAEIPYFTINTRTGLVKMLQNIRNEKVISVDLHVSKDDYMGAICLMNISTPQTNYCLDALKLDNELLMLTEIFINPKIVKVMYQAKVIMCYLQQNLHLYMVNIFDVEAAKAALTGSDKPSTTLDSILKNEFNFERVQPVNPNWRKRPLSDEYRTYLKSGTHFLIYIYHDYKNRLILKDETQYRAFLENCRNASKIIHCDLKTTIFKTLEDDLKRRHQCELDLLTKLFNWRARLAEQKNLKPDYILSKKALLQIVRELPTDSEEICSISPSQFVRTEVEKIKGAVYASKFKFKVYPDKQKKKPTINVPQGKNKRKLNFPEFSNKQQKRIAAAVNEAKRYIQEGSSKKMNEKFKPNLPKQKKRFLEPKQSRFSNVEQVPSFDNDSMNMVSRRYSPPESQEISNQNSVFLNPTNVPSPFTFQTSLTNSNRDNFNGPDESNISQDNFSLGIKRESDESDDILYRSLVDLKQVRDTLRMQGNSFIDNRKDLTAITQKIKTLQKRLRERHIRNRQGNPRNDDYQGNFRGDSYQGSSRNDISYQGSSRNDNNYQGNSRDDNNHGSFRNDNNYPGSSRNDNNFRGNFKNNHRNRRRY